MGLEKLLNGVQTAAILCNQWGDTGKGKFSDYFASQWADVSARGTGGNNAGHTVVIDGIRKIFHLIPAGITNDAAGKITILGNGMVIDLSVLCEELDALEASGNSYNNLMISKEANVIMPYHIEIDVAKDKSQSSGGIGTTGRGIGPCYTDKVARRGILISDLFNKEKLAKKIEKNQEFYPEQKINVDEIISVLAPNSKRIKPLVRDTVIEMHSFMRAGKKILLEGAQGLLLSIEHGTYPYVTSSDCSLNGTASGVGLSAKMIDLPLGVVKFPFMTRVGAGPFPTEFGGRKSEDYCKPDASVRNIRTELEKHNISYRVETDQVKYNMRDPKIISLINSNDAFAQGEGVRLAGYEFGATTGRLRRTGWTDAVAARYAVSINGPLMILTKADCLSDANNFKIGYGYDDGAEFSRNEENLIKSKPIYAEYNGYDNISDTKEYSKLPQSLKLAISHFEKSTGGNALIVSVGPDRNQTIVR